jgi:hypothetical protein
MLISVASVRIEVLSVEGVMMASTLDPYSRLLARTDVP